MNLHFTKKKNKTTGYLLPHASTRSSNFTGHRMHMHNALLYCACAYKMYVRTSHAEHKRTIYNNFLGGIYILNNIRDANLLFVVCVRYLMLGWDVLIIH